MAITTPRFRILPVRGTYNALLAEIDEINDNEICYAIDQDQYYQKEGAVLVQVGATKAQGAKADSAVQPVDLGPVAFSSDYSDLSGTPNVVEVGDNISLLTNNVNYVTQLQGASLYATAAQGVLANTAVQPGDNVSDLANDAGYVTDAGVTQIIAGTNVTISPTGGTGAVTVNASGGGSSVWSTNGTTAYYNTGTVSVGTDTPSAADALHLRGGVGSVTWPVTRFSYPSATVPTFDPLGQISFSDQNNGTAAAIICRNNKVGWNTSTSRPTEIEFYTTAENSITPIMNMVVTDSGTINLPNLPVHADEAAAVNAGLFPGDVYRTATGELRIKL